MFCNSLHTLSQAYSQGCSNCCGVFEKKYLRVLLSLIGNAHGKEIFPARLGFLLKLPCARVSAVLLTPKQN